VFEHRDILEALDANLPLSEKLDAIHAVVARRFPFVDHLVAAVYDPESQRLRTFAHGAPDGRARLHYETEIGSLQELLDKQRPRVIEDMSEFGQRGNRDSSKVAERGFLSCYTMPMFLNGVLFGFLFFNAREKNAFKSGDLEMLDVFGHLISLTVINELAAIRTLLSTVQAARDMTHHRDVETGAHVSRTAGYARVIAQGLSESHGLTSDMIEHVFLFAPLHDIGKIGVPDAILHKPARLDPDEIDVMRTHAQKGREIIDRILADFGLAGVSTALGTRWVSRARRSPSRRESWRLPTYSTR
jgi:HD-GYP domain-containing protein (c-di-GMP phosphodiesterase class II)